MSDELAIQPQVIQPKKDNSALYGTLGAAAGAGVGYWGVPKLMGKKIASHDDIIKDAKDQVDLSTKYSKAGSATIDEVKTAAQEFKEAETALNEAKKPVADVNHPDVKAYNDAVAKRQTAFDKLVSDETARLNKAAERGLGIDGIDPAHPEFKKAGDILDNRAFLKEEPAGFWEQTADKIRSILGTNKREYTRMTQAVENASADVRAELSRVGQPLAEYNALMGNLEEGATNSTDTLKGLYDDWARRYSHCRGASRDNFFNPEMINRGRTGDSHIFGEAMNMAERLYPDATITKHTPTGTLTNYSDIKHYYEMGGTFTEENKVLGRGIDRVKVQYYDPETGVRKKGFIEFEVAQRDAYVDNIGKDIIAKRREEAGKLLENARKYAELVESNSETKIKEAIDAGLKKSEVEALGFRSKAGAALFTDSRGVNVAEIIREAEGTSTIVKDGVKYEGFGNDIARLDGYKGKTLPRGLNGHYYKAVTDRTTGAVTYVEATPKEALKMAQARQNVVTMRKEFIDDFAKSWKALLEEPAKIQELNDVISRRFANDETLQKAITELRERFPNMFKEGSASSLSAAEIEKLAKEFADKNIDSRLQSEIDRLKPAYDKAATETGKVDAEAVKKAEELFNTKKNALDSKAKALAEKLGGMSGKNKALCALGGAAIAGLATWFATKPSEA